MYGAFKLYMLNNRWGKPAFDFDSSACKFVCLIKKEGKVSTEGISTLLGNSTRHTFFITVIVGDIHTVIDL